MDENFEKAKEGIPVHGFLKYEALMIPQDLTQAIQNLKSKKSAIILSDFHQNEKVQALADCVGNSHELLRNAQKSSARVLVVCATKGLAESIKVLHPEKLVLVPDLLAGNAQLRSCSGEDVQRQRNNRPNLYVLATQEADLDAKAASDALVTIENLEAVLQQLPKDKKAMVVPEIDIERWLFAKTGVSVAVWNAQKVARYPIDDSTLEKIYLCLEYELPIIESSPKYQDRVARLLQDMLKLYE